MSRPTYFVLAVALSAAVAGCGAVTNSPAESPAAVASIPAESPAAVASIPAELPTATCEPAGAGTVESTQVVPGTANIFGAGHDSPPAPGGGGGGVLPSVWELPSGSTVVTIPSVTGEVTPVIHQPRFNGPEGDTSGAGGTNTNVTSYEGISGIVNRGNGMFLVGVFLTDTPPADPAPPRLDFTGQEDFETLAPEIAQTFLIGDGENRTYCVPSGASRLFIGFADAAFYEGEPGWYLNNGGELQVTVAVAGE